MFVDTKLKCRQYFTNWEIFTSCFELTTELIKEHRNASCFPSRINPARSQSQQEFFDLMQHVIGPQPQLAATASSDTVCGAEVERGVGRSSAFRFKMKWVVIWLYCTVTGVIVFQTIASCATDGTLINEDMMYLRRWVSDLHTWPGALRVQTCDIPAAPPPKYLINRVISSCWSSITRCFTLFTHCLLLSASISNQF